jgi:hypothetical protein
MMQTSFTQVPSSASQTTFTLTIGIPIIASLFFLLGFAIYIRRRWKKKNTPPSNRSQVVEMSAIVVNMPAGSGATEMPTAVIFKQNEPVIAVAVAMELEAREPQNGISASESLSLSSIKVDVDPATEIWKNRVKQLEQFYFLNDVKLSGKTEAQLRIFTLDMLDNYTFAGIIKNIQKKYPDCELPKRWIDDLNNNNNLGMIPDWILDQIKKDQV